MRQFHSYGPVDARRHFSVPRTLLVQQCFEALVGDPEEGGHYFTIWAPRQSGKTWLTRQVQQKIAERYGDRFAVFNFSLGRLRGMELPSLPESDRLLLPRAFREMLHSTLPGKPAVHNWQDFYQLFSREAGLWDRPVIMLIDEVDTLPATVIDLMVAQFRELYLSRESNWLHGLALIGVRAVLGIESRRGSPFNIQQSLHVPNLTEEEVTDLYHQYQDESGQTVDSAVVAEVFRVTNGQPGLVSWFGELLTDRYNPGQTQPIGLASWKRVWLHARFTEPNNTVVNLIAKAREPEFQPFLLELFTHAEIPFSFHQPIQSYLYMHGILDSVTVQNPNGEEQRICRFASPFVQQCLYYALSDEFVWHDAPVLPLDPFDELTDVFRDTGLNVPAILTRYKDYLKRLKTRGINPWKAQPRRATDFHLTEAVGHFHLFTWLQSAIGKQCVISPEFPTGNGKVDLHLRCGDTLGIIEVKSFVNAYQASLDRQQAARYAQKLGLDAVTLAIFLPLDDETTLEKLSGEHCLDGVRVMVVAIGWT